MNKLYLFIALLLMGSGLIAQKDYTSVIVDESGDAVPAANVHILNTEIYAIAEASGEFTISTEEENFTIEISSIGYVTRQVNIADGMMPESITLESSAEGLNEVVVTALGLEREKQSLGSSVSRVDGAELNEVPQPNLVNSLSGMVAGVQTTNGSSGVGSSSRIIIRGENSLSGSNQPLFVVDGVPIRNRQIGSELINDGSFAEVDYGNGAGDIDPGDIESVSILKGPGSAALYGSRAANGVVLISTKDGRKSKGLGITTNSSLTFQTPLTFPQLQNEYGGGSQGNYSFENGAGGGINDGGLSSFGPKLDEGLMIKQFDGPSTDMNGNIVRGGDIIARRLADGSLAEIQPTEWVSRPDNIRNFFETGVTSQNNVALSTSNESTAVRASYGNLRHKGMLPNTDFDRDGISFSLDHAMHEDLELSIFADYINTRSENRPNLGYGYENVMYGFNWTGRQANIESMKDYWQAGQEGVQHYDINYLWLTNPYMTLYENTNGFNKNRLFGNASLNYNITDHLSFRVRTGTDVFNSKRTFRRAFSTNRKPFGGYREDNVFYQEFNTDALLSYKNRVNSEIKYSISGGANRFDQTIDYQYSVADQLAVPGVYTLDNSRVPLTGSNQEYRKRINSVYGIGNVSYRNLIYMNFTARNDWSSTLPLDNNSYAYYSASLSTVFSRIIDLPEFISYGKLRLSAASVGNDTDPYQLNNTFRFNENYASYFRLTNDNILKNADLKPERLNAFELGTEIWFMDSRLQLDVSAYQNTSVNQIIGRPISFGTGFSNVIENGGEVQTRGLEAMLKARIIESKNFNWLASLNYSTYRSRVTRLPEGVTQYVTGEAKIFGGGGGANTVFYIAREGGLVGDMYGSGFVEIDGEILYGPNGLPVQDNTLRLLGNYNPDFTMGFRNEFNMGDFSFSFLFDWRHGGTFVSRTTSFGSTSGILQETLEGREEGIIGDGVKNIGNDENPEYVPNDISVSASQFYNNFYDRGNEAAATYDASYLKLRQINLSYRLPSELCKSIGFEGITVGLIGSNLLLFTENPHVDPELNALEGPVQTFGVEDASYPSARSYGFILKTTF